MIGPEIHEPQLPGVRETMIRLFHGTTSIDGVSTKMRMLAGWPTYWHLSYSLSTDHHPAFSFFFFSRLLLSYSILDGAGILNSSPYDPIFPGTALSQNALSFSSHLQVSYPQRCNSSDSGNLNIVDKCYGFSYFLIMHIGSHVLLWDVCLHFRDFQVHSQASDQIRAT